MCESEHKERQTVTQPGERQDIPTEPMSPVIEDSSSGDMLVVHVSNENLIKVAYQEELKQQRKRGR